ncbi:MAG: iron-sulfur cluster biosynthesis transcriptional regulator SufR [Synechococcaceae cyanobacterium SM2_3_60]|nr:iron-sulfur cluster biosynthesis transcriptional regulator SufR [Synechococcaceae cyanobacterium SM2_3_60]
MLNSTRDAKAVILQLLRRRGQATAKELATDLDISPQAVRRHLQELEEAAMISHSRHTEGLGRPQHMYVITDTGRAQFPSQYDEFAVSFLTTLADHVGPEQLETVLHHQWQQKALSYRQQVGQGSLPERIDRFAELRSAEGYMVDWHPHSQAGYVLAEYNCAISQVATNFPTVCGHELEMFAAVFPDCTVERTHWMVGQAHRCGYWLQSR